MNVTFNTKFESLLCTVKKLFYVITNPSGTLLSLKVSVFGGKNKIGIQ